MASMTTPMIDRLKERIGELEQTNAVLQTLFAAAIGIVARADGRDPGEPGCRVFIPAEDVVAMNGRTITSEPVTHGEHFEEDSDDNGRIVGVYVGIDPVDLPDFGGDMQEPPGPRAPARCAGEGM